MSKLSGSHGEKILVAAFLATVIGISDGNTLTVLISWERTTQRARLA